MTSIHSTLSDPQRASIDVRERIDVEELLVWAFRDQCVVTEINRALAGRYGPGPVPSSNASAIGRIMQLGTIVDTSGPGHAGVGNCRAPADAITVFEAVCEEDQETIGLLAHHAETASTPDWPEMVPARLVPWRNAAGKPLSDPGEPAKGVGRHTPLRLDHGPDLVEHDRQTYARWHAGLIRVANRLEGRLERFAVEGPSRWGPIDG